MSWTGSVVMLIIGLEIGGAETEMVQAAEKLVERGWKVRVVSMLPLTGLAQRLGEGGIEVSDLGMRRGRPSLRAFLALRRMLLRWRPDVLHSHMFHANILARLVRKTVKIPLQISTAQNISEGGRAREWLYRWTDRWTDLTTQVSAAGADRYLARRLVTPGKIEVVCNSVDPERFAPDRQAREPMRRELGLDDRFIWLAVGHLEAQKDYPNMLRAFAELGAADSTTGKSDSHLLIAGRGSRLDELQRLTADLGIARQVSFLGMRRDIPRLLNAADCFLMSSAWEGTPLAMLEATAAGLPVVATDVGGNGEVVVDGEGGWIVPAADSSALARAMGRMIALSAGERRRTGERARRRTVEHYSLRGTVDRWVEIYSRLAMGKPSTVLLDVGEDE